MNRFFRRMRRFRKSPALGPQGETTSRPDDLYRAETPQDVTDPRAKSQGHGKKTADKWNQ